MKMTTIELRKLTATDGMTLTDGDVFGKEIYLGKNDSQDNWREIPDGEAALLQAASEEDDSSVD